MLKSIVFLLKIVDYVKNSVILENLLQKITIRLHYKQKKINAPFFGAFILNIQFSALKGAVFYSGYHCDPLIVAVAFLRSVKENIREFNRLLLSYNSSAHA